MAAGAARRSGRTRSRVGRVGTRAGIVVTGTEVLTGRVTDRNGPWLAEELRQLGVDVGHVVVVGDRPEDLHAAPAFLAGAGVAPRGAVGGPGAPPPHPPPRGVGTLPGPPRPGGPGPRRRVRVPPRR